MNKPFDSAKTLALPGLCYIATCFFTAMLLYAIALLVDPPSFRLVTTGWIASFLFVATYTAVCCAGGLLGIWWIIASTESPVVHHNKSAALIGLISAGAFITHFTIGEDRLVLGALFVAITSVVIALVVRTYARGAAV